jgi:regulator of protease activity HflC (stomatin/prohibitin superfamily)
MSRMRLWLLVLLATGFASGCVVIEDGQVGVSKSLGRIADAPVGQGVALQFPVLRTIETWNVKLQELKETASVPSSEGLIVGLDTSLLFQVRAAEAPTLRKTVGRDYLELLVVPYLRSSLRDVVAGYPVRKVYEEAGRKEIAGKVRSLLEAALGARGIDVVDVLLRDVKLPQRFTESIEAKLTAEQQVAQKQFMLEQARKEAEIEVARAEGAARAQEIVRSTLSEPYLKYLWIKTLAENPNVIYVATEANMPLLRTTPTK